MRNKIFANTQEMGQLFFDEVFLKYDGPCIFSIQNALGHRFICLLENEINNISRYICVPVSIARYREFVNNKIPIRYLFTNSENNGVILLSNTCDEYATILPVKADDLDALNLPNETEYLDIKESYTQNELLLKTIENNYAIAQMSFEKNGTHRQSIKVKELSSITNKLQKVMNGITSDYIEKNGDNISKNLKSSLKSESQLTISKCYAASFGIEFEAQEIRDLLNDSAFDILMKQFVMLCDLQDNQDEKFYKENNESLKALRDYTKVLMINEFEMKFQTANSLNKVDRFKWDSTTIKRIYSFLSSKIDDSYEQLTEEGSFVAFSMLSRTFSFKKIDGTIISGKLDDDFDETVFDIEKVLTVLLDKRVDIVRTGDDQEKYTLLKIVQSK